MRNVRQLSGLTLEILHHTKVARVMNKLTKLAKLHPGLPECERISNKARWAASSTNLSSSTLAQISHPTAQA